MKKGKQILCPYCCERFEPALAHFRLNKAVNMTLENTTVLDDEDDDNSMLMGGRSPRSNSSSQSQVGSQEKILDQALYTYNVDYLGMNDRDAKNNAMELPFVEFDAFSPDFQYDAKLFNEYGYVNEVVYKTQKLQKRICPHCHNQLIDGAGKYDMIMLSVIGDTNVGKTVFLLILQEMIKQEKFNGSLLFMGTDAEKEVYKNNSEQLLRKNTLPKATDRKKVPIMPFLFKFTTSSIHGNSEKNVIIIFCDIAGEDTREKEALERNGYHLKASSGFLFLMDPLRFERIRHNVGGTEQVSNWYQKEVVTAIYRFLLANSHDHKSKTPTAIVLTKSDELDSISYFKDDVFKQNLLHDKRGKDLHPGFVDHREIEKIDSGIQKFLIDIGERELCDAKSMFEHYRFFLCSALGGEPETDPLSDTKVVSGGIQPYRITEAFYWIMMENGYIPYRHVEHWKNKKNETKSFELLFYVNEARSSIESRIEEKRKSLGLTGVLSALTGWRKVQSLEE
jgi:hypothetical protein